MSKQVKAPPKKDDASAERIKLVLDSIRGLVTTAFGIVGIAFLWWNWSELTGLISNLNKVEFAGVKAEFGNKTFFDYQKQLKGAYGDKGVLDDDQYRAVFYRALWMQPVLASTKLLWVDDSPEYNNVEMQLLTAFRINIAVARSNDQAIAELQKREYDIVISNIDGWSGPADKIPLSLCPVHWFDVPQSVAKREREKIGKPLTEDQKRDLLESWNKQSNAEPRSGFALTERIQKELPAEPSLLQGVTQADKSTLQTVPVILYTNFDQTIASKCTQTITWDAYVLYQSVLGQIERGRWRAFGKFTPPWLKEFVEKTTKPETRGAE
jgi:hypothetical protein